MNANLDPNAASFVRHRSARTHFDAIEGERLAILVHSSETGGKFSIMENIAQHGTATPMHTHAEDEVFYILDGEVLFSIHGQISTLVQGDVILIPAGAPHAWRNNSGMPVRMLALFSPGGLEQMFARIGGLDMPQIVALAAEYRTVLVGPPIEV